MKLKNTIFASMLLTFSVLPTFALAHSDGSLWRPGEPIVPCGQTTDFVGSPDDESRDCDQCEILHLVKHLIDFVMVAAAPILATLFFVIAGVYVMLGGANPGMLAQGKRMFKDTLIGLLIVMLAWLITNTLIKSLVDSSKVDNANWYSFSCSKLENI